CVAESCGPECCGPESCHGPECCGPGSCGPECCGPEGCGPGSCGPECCGPEGCGPGSCASGSCGPECCGPECCGPECCGPESPVDRSPLWTGVPCGLPGGPLSPLSRYIASRISVSIPFTNRSILIKYSEVCGGDSRRTLLLSPHCFSKTLQFPQQCFYNAPMYSSI
uniref:Uncharacterized protein n=1 Tax=Gadus morhua TaxID=8049 RepID=A0A8C5CWF3_GADMO